MEVQRGREEGDAQGEYVGRLALGRLIHNEGSSVSHLVLEEHIMYP